LRNLMILSIDYLTQLCDHMVSMHNEPAYVKEASFKNIIAFQTWRRNVEMATNSWFQIRKYTPGTGIALIFHMYSTNMYSKLVYAFVQSSPSTTITVSTIGHREKASRIPCARSSTVAHS